MERKQPRRERIQHIDSGHGGSGTSDAHGQMRDMLAHADHLIDSLNLLAAEDYLEQNRQTGGQ